jgi:hypothetical protein
VTGEQTVERVRKEVAAKPSQGPAIIKKRLADLPERERTRYAAAVLAAALETPARDYKSDYKGDVCDHIMRLYRAALSASPRSAVALMQVAYDACPENLAAIRDSALQETKAAGLDNMSDAIIAQANALAGVSGLAEGSLRATPVLGPLGGTINPANIGGASGFEKEKEKKPKKPKPEVSPSGD